MGGVDHGGPWWTMCLSPFSGQDLYDLAGSSFPPGTVFKLLLEEPSGAAGDGYPWSEEVETLVMTNVAMENDHRNSEFSH